MDLLQKLKDLEERLEQLERRRKVMLDWTPTVTQSGAVTVTINEAKYRRSNGLVYVSAVLTVTNAAAAVAGNSILIAGLPVNALSASALEVVGKAAWNRAGVTLYEGALMVFSATQLVFRAHNTANYMGADPSAALANNDVLTFSGWYRV